MDDLASGAVPESRLIDLLRPPPHRGPLIAAGAVVLAVGVMLAELRLGDAVGVVVHLLISGVTAAAILGIGLQPAGEGGRPPAYQSVLLVTGLLVFEDYPGDWTAVVAESELAEGEPHRAELDGVPVVVVRSGGELYALADRCSHRGGPLSDGEVSDGCITCPWHGSRFRLEDGSVERGPAAYPQPALDVRVSGGMVEVRDRA